MRQGLNQANNSHSRRDKGERRSLGLCSMSALIVWISAGLKSRPQ